MKLKYYLRGLGTGILFATIVLCISYSYRDVKNTDEESTNGTNVESSEHESSSKETSTEQESSSEENTTEEATTEEAITEETTTEEVTTEEVTTEEVTTEEATTPVQQPDVVTEVELTIYSGYTSYDVAVALEAAGVIENAADFDYYLSVNDYDYRISTGVFYIRVGASYEEIAEMITY